MQNNEATGSPAKEDALNEDSIIFSESESRKQDEIGLSLSQIGTEAYMQGYKQM